MYGTVLVNMDDRRRRGHAAGPGGRHRGGVAEGASRRGRDLQGQAGAYAEAARAGAPGAIQVADRWHLWHNLAEYAEKTVARHRGCLLAEAAGRQPATRNEAPDADARSRRSRRTRSWTRRPGAPPGDAHPGTLRRHPRPARRRPVARRDQPRHRPGPQDRAAVRPRRQRRRAARQGRTRESRLDEFKPYLCRRWNEGARDATALHAELRQQGWTGSARTVRRYLAPFRDQAPPPEPPPAVPKTRQITRLLLTRPDHLEPTSRPSSPASAPGAPTSTRSPATSPRSPR